MTKRKGKADKRKELSSSPDTVGGEQTIQLPKRQNRRTAKSAKTKQKPPNMNVSPSTVPLANQPIPQSTPQALTQQCYA